MNVSIAVHKENVPTIKSYIMKICDKENDVHHQYQWSPFENGLTYCTKYDWYEFLTVDFLENYSHSALYTNLFYYPESEKNNKKMMNTIYVNTRQIDYTDTIHLPNVFPYDENKRIDYMKKELRRLNETNPRFT